jgi:glycosyltransferase involved in cell wall biosynthesis
MNIYVIPSWYPSPTDPTAGIFVREQTVAMARQHPGAQFGISVWGQNDRRYLLPVRTPVQNLVKWIWRPQMRIEEKTLDGNLTEYYCNTYTWTWRLLKGNIAGILKSNLQNLEAFMRKTGPVNLIHAHTAFPAGYIAMKLSERTGIPYIIHEHMSPFPFKVFKNSNYKLHDRIHTPYLRSARNICVSRHMRQSMRQYDIPSTTIINNFVDGSFFTFRPKNKDDHLFTFFMLGRLVHQKGVEILLHSFKVVISKYPTAGLRIAGDGSLRRKYERMAVDLGLVSNVKWLGNLSREEIRFEFIKSHAFVLASRHEGLPISILEAIATGRPVIGTVCGGPEEIINDTNGYLVPPEDPLALADAMMRMVDNYDRFDQASIRADFEQRFSSRVITREIYDLYKEVISRHSAK